MYYQQKPQYQIQENEKEIIKELIMFCTKFKIKIYTD